MRFSSFAVLSFVALLASAYLGDELGTLPHPRDYSAAKQTEARPVRFGSNYFVINDPNNICNETCHTLLTSYLQFSVNGSIMSQKDLPNWHLSPFKEFDAPPTAAPNHAAITGITVKFNSNYYGETYVLEVDEGSKEGSAIISTGTTIGAMRGLETFAQLLEWNTGAKEYVVERVPIKITDAPRFSWRGLMVDVARHYLPVKKLLDILDACAVMKLNTLHIHFSDAQSFPLRLKSFDSKKQGTPYNAKAVYTADDIKKLNKRAEERGVTIIPEFDVPGHTASWRGFGNDVTADCFEYLGSLSGVYEENLVTLNPASQDSWNTITGVINDASKLFTGNYIHVGGDEVNMNCWKNAKQKDAIDKFMKDHGLSSYSDIEKMFDVYAQTQVTSINRIPIVWDDAFRQGFIASKNTLIHSWTVKSAMEQAVRAGYNVITSIGYYLDRQDPLCQDSCTNINWLYSYTYRKIYHNDPLDDLSLTDEEKKRVLGAEAAMWAESVDHHNFDSMALTRLAAFAERLWSPQSVKDNKSLERRSLKMRCKMIRRGIATGTGPLSTDYCETKDYF